MADFSSGFSDRVFILAEIWLSNAQNAENKGNGGVLCA